MNQNEAAKENMGKIIQVRGVDKNFEVADQYTKVIKNMNFDVIAGEFVMIHGPSGSGKSTLLHMINGWEEPTNGYIFIEGTNVYIENENKRAKIYHNTIGMVHQQPFWIKSLSVLENIQVPYWLSGHKRKESLERAAKIISLLGLEEFSNYKPMDLSGGQQQRISLLRSLINNPKIIIADEPTGNLDSKTADLLMELFLEINSQLKRTIIMATHNTNLLRYATKIIHITDGMIDKLTVTQKNFKPQEPVGDVFDLERIGDSFKKSGSS